jgi:hypothetical protein
MFKRGGVMSIAIKPKSLTRLAVRKTWHIAGVSAVALSVLGAFAWGSVKVLGRLANKELRQMKQKAHAEFDPIWQAKAETASSKNRWHARNAGYKWLAQQIGITREKCHIGMFDVATCRRVIEICKPYADRIRANNGGQNGCDWNGNN